MIIFKDITSKMYLILLLSFYCLSSTIWINDPSDDSEICPNGCQCENNSVECKHRLLRNVPKLLPEKTVRLNLLGNRINVIKKTDFLRLSNLKVLQLSNNRITSIEQEAFDNLINLIKLKQTMDPHNGMEISIDKLISATKKLNRNLIQFLPDGLFSKLVKLQKLDLRDNQLQCVNENVFNKLGMLKFLYLDRNKIFWISESISKLKHLRAIQIQSNKLNCNCHLAWLNLFMKQQPDIIKPDPHSVLCAAPFRLSRIPISSLSSYEFQCANEDRNSLENICQPDKRICSKQCICSQDGIVKCTGKQLTNIPQDLPGNIIELDLQDNNITVLRQGFLAKYKFLKKIILTRNGMVDIEPGAFIGLQQLTSLYLNLNNLRTIRKNSFKGLASLMFLYLHNNEIECLPKDTFEEVKKLYLLHLSENKLTGLRKEILDPLSKLRYLYLVHNPLNCNCKLFWLAEFLKFKEANGTPVASCLTPTSVQGLPVRNIQSYNTKCNTKNDERYDTHDEECIPKVSCPDKCTCTSEIVNCSGSGLHSIPDNIFPSTKSLILSHNKLKKLSPIYSIQTAPNLVKLDISHNEIEQLDPDVFSKSTRLKEINLNSNKLKCINNRTFRTLFELEILQLSDNQITCITEDSFKENINLKFLMLNKNFFHCDCHMKWISEWSRMNYNILGSHRLPNCQSPDNLKATPITLLDMKYFLCEGNVSVSQEHSLCDQLITNDKCCSIGRDECDKSTKCPHKCKCELTKVDCSEIQLKEIPSEIPEDTTELYLDRNDIKSLNKSSFKNLLKLKTLYLSYNGITELNKDVLTPLKSLETLVLSFNKLQCIHQDAFKNLVNLKVLILQSNDVSTIPFQAFRDLKKLNNIALGQNPFHCDCNIKWLNQFFLERYLDNGISLCASPEKMKLKSIYHSKPTEFVCSEETEDAYITAKCDGCMKNPCKHNGKCSLITHHDYQCDCPYPFHGKNCEKRINACFGQPCRNGGICKNIDNFGNYECICPAGFRGPKCTLNINDCVGHKCVNGATCVDLVNSYSCNCPNGFRGKYCDIKFSYCHDVNPCLNSGQCQPMPNNDFKCICLKGWEGNKCELNIDDCKYNSCKHESSCVDLLNKYKCVCRPGYVGVYCEEHAWKPSLLKTPMSRRDINQNEVLNHYTSKNDIISESVCAYHECLNEGTCVSEESNKQKSYCKCKPGFSGQLCQYLDSLYFYNNSYIEISPPSRGFLMPKGNISLRFITNSSSGLIFYQGLDKSYLTVNLYHGHIRISYNLGDKVLGPEGYSMNMVNDNKLHLLNIEIIGENLTMYLDNRFHFTLKSKYVMANRYMALDAGIFVGGAPKKNFNYGISKYHLDSDAGFIGCIESVEINNKKIDFLKFISKSLNVKPGCGELISKSPSILQLPDDTEQNLKNNSKLMKKEINNICNEPGICKNKGICQIVDKIRKKFKCICKNGFIGKTCNKKNSTCHRKMVQNYIKDPDTLCLSIKKVGYRYCEGTCPNNRMQADISKSFFHKPTYNFSSHCCVPSKYRTREIQFQCENGRQYRRGVHFVRRCKCSSNCHME